MEKCSACGAPMQNGTCPYCGAMSAPAPHQQATHAQTQAAGQPTVIYNTTTVSSGTLIDVPPKNKWVAFFLCLFLGYFGAHNFYSGKYGMAVLYLLTFGLLGIGWIVDIFRILLGAYRDKWGRNLQG